MKEKSSVLKIILRELFLDYLILRLFFSSLLWVDSPPHLGTSIKYRLRGKRMSSLADVKQCVFSLLYVCYYFILPFKNQEQNLSFAICFIYFCYCTNL